MRTLKTGAISSPLMSETRFDAAFNDASGVFVAYSLFRDLGRQIVVFNDAVAGSPHTAIFRQVIFVRGGNTEGIGSSAVTSTTAYNKPFYLCVWADVTPNESGSKYNLEQVARVG
jgi:hypothetical protein